MSQHIVEKNNSTLCSNGRAGSIPDCRRHAAQRRMKHPPRMLMRRCPCFLRGYVAPVLFLSGILPFPAALCRRLQIVQQVSRSRTRPGTSKSSTALLSSSMCLCRQVPPSSRSSSSISFMITPQSISRLSRISRTSVRTCAAGTEAGRQPPGRQGAMRLHRRKARSGILPRRAGSHAGRR